MKLAPFTASIATPLAALLLAACGSSPRIDYYTLVSPPSPQARAGAAGGVDLAPVRIPAQVDNPALVLRQSGERIAPVENRQWIGPLAEEIRSALAARLNAQIAAVPGQPPLRVDVTVRRFESVLGQYALIEADYRLSPPRKPALNCHGGARQTVGAGYEALVAGHQRALDALADQIAAAVRASAAEPAVCPVLGN